MWINFVHIVSLTFLWKNTVGIRIPDVSGILMFESSPDAKWLGIKILFEYQTNLSGILIATNWIQAKFVRYSNDCHSNVQYLNVRFLDPHCNCFVFMSNHFHNQTLGILIQGIILMPSYVSRSRFSSVLKKFIVNPHIMQHIKEKHTWHVTRLIEPTLTIKKMQKKNTWHYVLIQDKLVYVQVITYCWYSVAQMCTWEECLLAKWAVCHLFWRHESKWAHNYSNNVNSPNF